MGIPSFFSWLVCKYPNIISPAYHNKEEEEESDDTAKEDNDADKEDEHDDKEDGEESSAVGCSEERIIFDNLYLDMNDIIHTCSSPKNRGVINTNLHPWQSA